MPRKPPDAEPKRRIRTPKERAEEALGIQARKVAKLRSAVAHQESLVKTYKADLEESEKRLGYLSQDPALTPDDVTRITGAASSGDQPT